MVHHTLDNAMDGVQEVNILAHGQHSVDLGVQQVVAVEDMQAQTSTGYPAGMTGGQHGGMVLITAASQNLNKSQDKYT